jgi:cytochrome c551/c552
MAMKPLRNLALITGMAMIGLPGMLAFQKLSQPVATSQAAEKPVVTYKPHDATAFHTSDRCVACHNGMKTASGADYSIGSDWESSLMANSSRDPYWQGSLRRETMDHLQAGTLIQNDCSICHMPAVRLADRDADRDTHVFERFPFHDLKDKTPQLQRAAQDGVDCAVCHQIKNDGLGTDSTFSGNVVIGRDVHDGQRPEYGPFDIDRGHRTIMHSSTGGFFPQAGNFIRGAALCGSCHTLYTEPIGPGGVRLGNKFPEQVPYQEWQHSAFYDQKTCQECHMPAVEEAVAITALYGEKREGARRHVFVGGNFVIEGLLQDHRDTLATEVRAQDLDAAIARTTQFLQTQTAKVTIEQPEVADGKLTFAIFAQNLTGHKLPTAFPSRRVWLHVTVRDDAGRAIFESGGLRPDGSIIGNANDDDPLRFEPHYRVITSPDQVEIYEPILGDSHGKVTTGLLNTVRYLKDNRLLPQGFDKATANQDVRVHGDAAADPGFTGGGSQVRYVVAVHGSRGRFHIQVELRYQPIGFRWAHNLGAYKASETQRAVSYFDGAAQKSAIVLAHAELTR